MSDNIKMAKLSKIYRSFTVVGLQTVVFRSSADFAKFFIFMVLSDSWRMDHIPMNIYGWYMYQWIVDIPYSLGRNNAYFKLHVVIFCERQEQWTVNPHNPPWTLDWLSQTHSLVLSVEPYPTGGGTTRQRGLISIYPAYHWNHIIFYCWRYGDQLNASVCHRGHRPEW